MTYDDTVLLVPCVSAVLKWLQGELNKLEVCRGKQISLFLGTLQLWHFALTKFVLLPGGLFSCCCDPLLHIEYFYFTCKTNQEEKQKTQHKVGKKKKEWVGGHWKTLLSFRHAKFPKNQLDMVLSSLTLLWAKGLDQIISRGSCPSHWCMGTKNCSQLFAVCRPWAAFLTAKKASAKRLWEPLVGFL